MPLLADGARVYAYIVADPAERVRIHRPCAYLLGANASFGKTHIFFLLCVELTLLLFVVVCVVYVLMACLYLYKNVARE
jgi:hypothetical protein